MASSFIKEKKRSTVSPNLCSVTEDHSRGAEEELDLISKLPDELLVKIMSGFDVTEAVRTSILSTRWKNVWRFIDEWAVDMTLTHTTLEKWQRRVNGAVTTLQRHSSRAPKLSKFRLAISMHNDFKYRGDIDGWLEFAISRKVESLHLEFDISDPHMRTIPLYIFSEGCYNHIKTQVGLSQIKSLMSLRLSYVKLRNEIVEHIIANCPMLEELALKQAGRLTELKVVGSSHDLPLALKYLEVKTCYSLRSVEIDHAPRLMRLIYHDCGLRKVLRVGECSSLVDWNLGTSTYAFPFDVLRGIASRLKSLSLKTPYIKLPPSDLPDLPELTGLERLTIELDGNGYHIFWLFQLIKLCPRLHTLQVFFHRITYGEVHSFYSTDVYRFGFNLESIKVVKIVGFYGDSRESRLVETVLENFDGLERIVIDRSLVTPYFGIAPVSDFKPESGWSMEQYRKAEKVALELKSKAPPSVEFIVI